MMALLVDMVAVEVVGAEALQVPMEETGTAARVETSTLLVVRLGVLLLLF